MTSASVRVSVRQVLAVREFRAIAASQGLSILGDQVARIAVALLVYDRTSSAFAASATYAASYLTWLVGGPVLTALSDRYPRRTVMIVCDLLRAVLVGVMALTPPLWAVFALVILVGLLAPPFDSARGALLPDVLTDEQFLIGNTIMNAIAQTGQAAGFLFGGALVALSGVRGALATDAVTFLVSAAAIVWLVDARPAGGEAGRFLLGEVREGFLLVRRTPRLRTLLTWAVLSAAVSIPPEGLAVPVAADNGNGAVAAGILTAAIPIGFLLGGALLIRGNSARYRERLPLLMVVSCLPLVASRFVPWTPAIAALWVLSGIGSVLQLVASTEYMVATPRDFRGRAYGIAVTALMSAQGAVLLVSGRIASAVDPLSVVSGVAVLGLLCVPLAVHLSTGEAAVSQDLSGTGRNVEG